MRRGDGAKMFFHLRVRILATGRFALQPSYAAEVSSKGWEAVKSALALVEGH